MGKYLIPLVLAVVLLPAGFPGSVDALQLKLERGRSAPAALAAPQLRSPASGTVLPGIGPVTLNWENPAGTTQYHIQVVPANSDGPGVNMIRIPETSLTIEAPVLGKGPYLLLPDMGYTWRIRATDKTTFAPEDDPSWGPWSESWTFRTAKVTNAGLQAVAPAAGGRLAAGGQGVVLRWSHPNTALFYWEVQVSGDKRFDLNPATATSFVFDNLVHGGASDPLNAWTIPAAAVGPCGAYFWRVRPRIQGDGTPLDWGPTWSLTTAGSSTVVDKIAFMHHNDVPNYEDIFLMNPDGSGRIRLTTTGGNDPTWSPDGCIAYEGGPGGITIMNADGKNAHPLGFDAGFVGVCGVELAWSPDGTRIVTGASRGDRTDLYLINVADSSATRLTSQNDNQCANPTWSPDSKRIAFSSTPPEAPLPYIYVINADGSNLTRLFPGSGGTRPAWSPDGTKILFKGNGATICPFLLCVMSPDGSGLTELPETGDFDQPAWSADGTKIVAREVSTNSIWIMNADGSGKTDLSRLKEGEGFDLWPAWSPKPK